MKKTTSQHITLSKVGIMALGMAMIVIIIGCSGNYGAVKSNSSVTGAFENKQVPSDYRYYYYGRSNMPYVIIGLDSEYNLQSRMWRLVNPDSKEFQHMVYWTWAETWHYPNSPRGSDILDPEGKKIGIWYSSVRWAAVKILDDKGSVMIAPNMPWMQGGR